MDMEQLVYDLSFGIRLPNPTFCPISMAMLIKQCFYEKPSKRPNFEEIKSTIKATFNVLMHHAKTKSKRDEKDIQQINALSINKLKDNAMKSRYTTIKKGNQEEKGKYTSIKVAIEIENDRNTSPLNYVCIERDMSVGTKSEINNESSINCKTDFTDKSDVIEESTNVDIKYPQLDQQTQKLERRQSFPIYSGGKYMHVIRLSKSTRLN